MSEWIEKPLSALAEIRVSNVDKKSFLGEEAVLLCNYMDAYTNDYIYSHISFMEATASLGEITKFRVDCGDVVITKDSETPDDIGIPAVVMERIPGLVCGYHLALLKTKQELIDPVFLCKQLSSERVSRYFGQRAAGSTRYGLSNSALANTPIPMFKLANQKKIAAILISLDKTIEKTEALIAKYQQIKAGLMHDLFTRGVLPNGQLRPPRSEAPQLYQETEIGWIPREWEVETLRTACDWYSGGTPSKRNETWWKGALPWLSPKDMKRFELSDTEDHVTRQAALSGSRIVPKGSVFIVVRGMILAHSFPVVMNRTEFAFNQDVKAVICRSSLINRFLAYWFVANTDLFLKKTTESTHGTKRFDLNDLYKIEIGVPSKLEQQRVIDRLDIVEKRIDAEIEKRNKLSAQKIGLMQDLLTGKVRVQVNEPDMEVSA
jgi:type I restriction enzyme S subunit